MMELTAEQGAALAALDERIAAIGEAFDAFVQAADACEQVHLPGNILQAKAMELQGEIARRMMQGMVPA